MIGPQTLEQANYIREWAPRVALSARERRAAAVALSPATDGEPEEHLATLEFSDTDLAPIRGLRERFQGALQGLAIGDALAAATQYRRAGSFAAVGDLLGQRVESGDEDDGLDRTVETLGGEIL